MNQITEESLDEVEEVLGICLPKKYRSLLTSLPEEFYGTPKEYFSFNLILNAEELISTNLAWDLRVDDWDLDLDEEVEGYFVIGIDGCGNHWLIDPDEDNSAVYFLEHDPERFSDKLPSIDELEKVFRSSYLKDDDSYSTETTISSGENTVAVLIRSFSTSVLKRIFLIFKK